MDICICFKFKLQKLRKKIINTEGGNKTMAKNRMKAVSDFISIALITVN